MSMCIACQTFLPPDFLTSVGKSDKMCIWCHRGISSVPYKDENGKMVDVTKEQVAKEYKEFMKLLLEKKKIRNMVFRLKE